MDDLRFDELSRRLAAATSRRGGLKAALGALLGGAAGAAALDAEAKGRKNRGDDRGADADRKKKRKKHCKPACADGQRCVKGACVCDNGGTVCGVNCCALGQRCEGGQCVSEPQPDACIAFGEPCKGTGRRCCEGLACGSGQGGLADVACYVRKTGPCTSTAECTFGTRCEDGICKGIPQPTPVPPAPPAPQCVAKGGTCPAETACCDGTRCVDGSCSDCQTTAAHLVNYTQSNGNNGFNKPREAAFLADGRMLIADQDNSRFQIWTQSGGTWSYQAAIPAGKFDGNCPNITAGTTSTAKPYALAVDPLDPGVFYYVEQYGCFVMGCTGSGTSWSCTPAINENNFPTVVEINDLAFDSAGRMFLVHESGTGDAIMIDRPTGGWAANKANWPLTPTAVFFANSGQGASDDPQGITVGPDGLVYVADTDKNRITVWKETSPGTFSLDSEFGTAGSGVGNLNKPRGVEVLDGTVVVTDSGNARISLWTQDGGTWTNTDTFPNPATAGSGTAQLNSPSHCLPSADGRYYVADTNNNRISVWKAVCK